MAPVYWRASEWRWVGVTAAGVALAYYVDNPVRDHFAKKGLPLGSDTRGLRDAAPLAVLLGGTLASGLLANDETLTRTSVDMTEALLLGSRVVSGLTRLLRMIAEDAVATVFRLAM